MSKSYDTTELSLYADDFIKHGDWLAVCMALDLPKGYDKITLEITNVTGGYTDIDARGDC